MTDNNEKLTKIGINWLITINLNTPTEIIVK